LPGNELSGLERVEASVNHEEADTVPIIPLITYALARHVGYTVREFCYDAKKLFKAVSWGYERFGYDGIIAYADVYLFAQAAGLSLEFPEDGVPHPKESPIKSLEDVDALSIPDVQRDGRLPILLKAVELASKKYGKKVAIYSGGQGPFSLAAEIRGLERFLMDIYVNQELAEKLIKFAAEYMVELGESLIKSGAHILHLGDSFAGPEVISPQNFSKWAIPMLKRVFHAWKKQGAITSLHICGNSSRIWQYVKELKPDIFEVDHVVSLRSAKSFFESEVCLMGNVDPSWVLHRASMKEVEVKTRECVANAAEGGGYILSSGCLIMPGFLNENLKTFMKAGRAYGKYPVKDRNNGETHF
jgi:uroporphyrinogen decarboxylase